MRKYLVSILILCLFFLSCVNENVENFSAEITSVEATEITESQATLNGTLTKLGSSAITNIGFEIYVDSTAAADGLGEQIKLAIDATSVPLNIEHTITGLASETEYFFLAYAHTSENQRFGDVLRFTTQ